MPLFRNRLFSIATARSNAEIQKSDRDRFCCEWRGAPQWIQNSMCAGKIRRRKDEGMCLLILKVRLRARALACLRLISEAGERNGLPCDIHQLCHPGLIYNMIAYTQRENAHARSHITTNLGSDLSGSTRAQARMGCVTPPQCSRIPAGSLVTRRSSSLFALQVNGRGGGGHAVMSGTECRRGNRPEAYCGDGAISTSAPVATQTGTWKCTHTGVRKLLRWAVLSPVITLLPLWHGEIGAIWTPL